ncbi:hypothetical protein MRX96_032128 [Rhipicephalus microplus]
MFPHIVSLKPSGWGPSRAFFPFLYSAAERTFTSRKNKEPPAGCELNVRESHRTKTKHRAGIGDDCDRNAPPPLKRRYQGPWRHPSQAADYPFMEKN